MHSKIPNLISVKTLAKLYPDAFSENRVRDLIYHAEPRLSARGETISPNGFASCVIRCAGRVLIDLDAVPRWLEKGRAAPLAEPSGSRYEHRPLHTVTPHDVGGDGRRQRSSTRRAVKCPSIGLPRSKT